MKNLYQSPEFLVVEIGNDDVVHTSLIGVKESAGIEIDINNLF